jgi:hypothetical protein
MPKPSKHTASRRANLAAAEAVIEQIPDQEILERTLLESQTKLYNAQQQIASLESVLSDKVAACSELSLSLGETEMKAEEYLSQISEQKAQYLIQRIVLRETAVKTGNYKKRPFRASNSSTEGCCFITFP